MRTIAIILGDNDYGNIGSTLLYSIIDVLEYYDNNLAASAVEQIIRAGIEFHVIAYQPSDNVSASIKYVMNNLRVLFDDEADTFIAEHEHDGGSWFITRTHDGWSEVNSF
jgi:hypothetical protein